MSRKMDPRPRPEPKRIEVTVRKDGEDKKVEVWDLDSIVRGILWDIQQEGGLSERQLALRLNLVPQQVTSFLSGETGTSLRMLSRICGVLSQPPDDFFRRHETYRQAQDEATQVRHIEDSVFQRFRPELTLDSAGRLAAVIEALNRSGDPRKIATYLAIGEQAAGISEAPSDQNSVPRPRPRRAKN